ncbi:unnamed protein product, partial [Polarella glacialis]
PDIGNHQSGDDRHCDPNVDVQAAPLGPSGIEQVMLLRLAGRWERWEQQRQRHLEKPQLRNPQLRSNNTNNNNNNNNKHNNNNNFRNNSNNPLTRTVRGSETSRDPRPNKSTLPRLPNSARGKTL